MKRYLKQFLGMESASSLVLALMVVLAMLFANSSLSEWYEQLHAPLANVIINDGLMALFFLVIGIELKQEMIEGSLSSLRQALLPVVAALGGVVFPALIYWYFNAGSDAVRGWAIPMATDIAFALGVVGFFVRRLPPSLRIFLMALAVIDDLMAILVIAFFYTSELSIQALCMVVAILWVLVVYNRKVTLLLPFILAGAALWVAVHASGVHATLAGVALGMLLPLSMGKRVMHALHAPVAYGVIPIFVFANAGVSFDGLSLQTLGDPVVVGIALGLFAGKQLGIFIAAWLMLRLGFASLPVGASLRQFYAVCIVAGIGFTMSLFIGTLAFEGTDYMTVTRLGVIIGSLASAACGAILLAVTLPKEGVRS